MGGAGQAVAVEHKRRKLTAPEVRSRKGQTPLVMVTAVDFGFARLAEAAGVDMLLVGDSLGMAFQGHDSTVPVTVDDIVYHCRAVRRGASDTHVVADLPFLAGAIDDAETIRNAGRLLQEGGADAVKLEGGVNVAGRIRALTNAGIPTFGHVGLTPQRAGMLGGFKMQGGDAASAQAVLSDAVAVADAGAYAMVVEAVPLELGRAITERVPIPTIGIGAGAACDGQVLVTADLLGIEDRFRLKFVKRYANLAGIVRDAYAEFAEDVRSGAFPTAQQSYRGRTDLGLDGSASDATPDREAAGG